MLIIFKNKNLLLKLKVIKLIFNLNKIYIYVFYLF